jgi:hypothetical protein
MAKTPPGIQRRIDAGIKVLHDDAATWMPKGKPRFSLVLTLGAYLEGEELTWAADIQTKTLSGGVDVREVEPRLLSAGIRALQHYWKNEVA